MKALGATLLVLFAASSCAAELLIFSAAWCTPCQLMKPATQRLLAEGYPVRVVDVEQEPQLARQYKVRDLPALVVRRDGRVVDQRTGSASYAQVKQLLQRHAFHPSTPPDRPADTRPTSDRRHQRPLARQASAAVPQQQQQQGRSGGGAQRAMGSTVRLKVEDATGHSYGTGTVIDVHGEEALVVTCAHIFRESKGKGKVTADVFYPQPRTLPHAQLLKHDSEGDVALVIIRTGGTIIPSPVAAENAQIRPQGQVFSIGCDRGGNPSLHKSQIVDINRYLGPENILVQGQPVDGRSGGGLFNQQGELIGICNAADPDRNEGLYASLSVVHRLLDQNNLAHVHERGEHGLSADRGRMTPVQNRTGAVPSQMAATAPTPRGNLVPMQPPRGRSNSASPSIGAAPRMGAVAAGPIAARPPAGLGPTSGEVVCVVRSPDGGASEVIVVKQPSEQILTALRRAGNSKQPLR